MRVLIVSQTPRARPNSPGNARIGSRGGRLTAHTKSRLRCKTGKHHGGFTLVELLIVLAILMTLTAIAVPNLMATIDQAKIAKAVGDIEAIETDIAWYQTIYGRLPDDLSQIGDGNYLDPWGNPYQYLNHSTMKGNGQARLASLRQWDLFPGN